MRTRIAVALGLAAALGGMPVPLSSDPVPRPIPVQAIDVGLALGRPGLKVRLTLSSGEAVEFRTEDPAETEATLRMADLFLSGRARLLAEMDGSTVRALQVSGPAVSLGK